MKTPSLLSMALATVATSLMPFAANAQSDVLGGTLNKIYDQDKLVCGISTGVAGFSQRDERGRYAGFDVDFCRAVAAAILGDDSKVEYVELGSAERFDALANGQVDVLFRNTTWTLSRDITRLMDFAGLDSTGQRNTSFSVRAGVAYSSVLRGRLFNSPATSSR